MANIMNHGASSIQGDFSESNSMKDDREEFHGELDLSLDLSLGRSIGKPKENRDKEKERPSLRKYPSENLQPCLRKFALGNFHASVDKDGDDSRDNGGIGIELSSGRCLESWKNFQKDNKPASAPLLSRSLSSAAIFKETVPLAIPHTGSTTVKAAAWPQSFNIVENEETHKRILRTCSGGFVPPATTSVLHRQPSLDVLFPDAKQDGVQSRMQKEFLEKMKKRELHAIRRQEAKKKRGEKQQKKARRDEGKSYTQNRASLLCPVSSSTIPSISAIGNKWVFNPDICIPHTNQTQIDPKDGGRDLLEAQRSLQRDKDRVAKEIEPRSDKEKKAKKKEGGGSMDPLPYDLGMETGIPSKIGIADPNESSKCMDKQANGTTKSNSPMTGGCATGEESKGPSQNEHKSSGHNAGEVEATSLKSHPVYGETPGVPPAPAVSVPPMPYPFQMPATNAQCMAMPVPFSFPYMMPFYASSTQTTGSEPSKCNGTSVSNVVQPVSAHGFPPIQAPVPGTPPNWQQMPQAKVTVTPMPGSVQVSHVSRTSSGRILGIPEQDNRSSEGASSNDTNSQSSKSTEASYLSFQSLSRVPSVNKAQGQILSFSEGSTSNKLEPAQCKQTVEKVSCTTAKSASEMPPIATSQERPTEACCKTSSPFVSDSNDSNQRSCINDTSAHSLEGQTKQRTKNSINDTLAQDSRSNLKSETTSSQLTGDNASLPTWHWVTTTGVGPNGITISGILSSYSSSHVRIVCICHGTQMSPAEFVQHAGSIDVSNPERSIVVNPIPVKIAATLARG